MNSPVPITPRILVADDEADVTVALSMLLRAEGFHVEAVRTPAAALEALSRAPFDLLMTDLNYDKGHGSPEAGLDLIRQVSARDLGLPIVVLTAFGHADVAVTAMKAGAADYVVKPWDNDRLVTTVRVQLKLAQAQRERERLQQAAFLRQHDELQELVGTSSAMVAVRDLVDRIAASTAPVLITGENGTGKGIVARMLHALSARAGGPFVSVNTAGLSDGVADSELFGHVKGAFTGAANNRMGRFEAAGGGTLFLDEIADISPALQSKLLRVLETGEYERLGSSRTLRADIRLVTATNADLRQRVAQGRFREDLLYRLNTVEITLPPLRARAEDVLILARYFLARHAARYRRPILSLTPAAEQALQRHAFPGNVRELAHTIERAVLLSRGSLVDVKDLGLAAGQQTPLPVANAVDGGASTRARGASGPHTIADSERSLIQRTLAQHNGQVLEAARALGLSRSALYRRLAKYGLDSEGREATPDGAHAAAGQIP